MDFDGLVQSPQLEDDILRFEAGTKHGTKALMVMDDLRRREQLSDVTICVGKRRICAHKLVLASFSSYFLAMFTGGMIESSQDKVTLKDIDGKAVEALIDFAYTGKLDITTDCVQPLLYASSLFQLTAIQKACSDFLSRQLHPSNCLGIKSFADAHSCTELLHASEKYINEHFTDVVKNEEFLLLPHEDLAAMLASEELNVDSEEDVYNSLITWARHDLEERQSLLAVLLEKIRLPLLSASFLIDQVEKEELIRQDIACRNLLDEAKNFHLLPERRLNASKSKYRQFCPRKSTLGILYSVGGMDSTGHSVRTVEKYDFHSGKVRLVCPTNIPRSGVGLAVVDKKLYAVGGHDGTTYLNR